MHTFQDFAGGLLMNPCINIYDPVMTNLTHNFSPGSPYTQTHPQEKPNLQISSSLLPATDFQHYRSSRNFSVVFPVKPPSAPCCIAIFISIILIIPIKKSRKNAGQSWNWKEKGLPM